MAPRKPFTDRCKSTLRAQKTRAKKGGAEVTWTAEQLEALVPAKCRWCTCRLTPSIINFDHKTPLNRGGEWTLDNLEVVCAGCNRKKSILTVAEYKLLLQKLSELTAELGSDFVTKNVLARLAAGAAWIHAQ